MLSLSRGGHVQRPNPSRLRVPCDACLREEPTTAVQEGDPLEVLISCSPRWPRDWMSECAGFST